MFAYCPMCDSKIADARPGDDMTCPHCRKRVIVDEGRPPASRAFSVRDGIRVALALWMAFVVIDWYWSSKSDSLSAVQQTAAAVVAVGRSLCGVILAIILDIGNRELRRRRG